MIKYIKFLSLTVFIALLLFGIGMLFVKLKSLNPAYAFSIGSLSITSALLADNILKDKKD